MKAARIHLEETVFFGQVVFHDLEPKRTVEVCAGFGIPSITLKKLFGVTSSCVDTDSGKMAVGALISQKLGIDLIWEHRDLFLYLRHHAQELKGATLLATAAYCQDKKKGRPKGSGEKISFFSPRKTRWILPSCLTGPEILFLPAFQVKKNELKSTRKF